MFAVFHPTDVANQEKGCEQVRRRVEGGDGGAEARRACGKLRRFEQGEGGGRRTVRCGRPAELC